MQLFIAFFAIVFGAHLIEKTGLESTEQNQNTTGGEPGTMNLTIKSPPPYILTERGLEFNPDFENPDKWETVTDYSGEWPTVINDGHGLLARQPSLFDRLVSTLMPFLVIMFICVLFALLEVHARRRRNNSN